LQDENLFDSWKNNIRSNDIEVLRNSVKNAGLREEYNGLVKALLNKRDKLLEEGKNIEEVAKTLQAERRQLTIQYKHSTPDDFLEWIFKRNDITYTQTGKGDEWGATYEGLFKINAKKKFNIDDLDNLNQQQIDEINASIAKSSSFTFGGTKQELGENFYNFFKTHISSTELEKLENILIKYRMK